MSRGTNDPMANLMSPLSAREISTLLGNISDAAATLGDPDAGRTAIQNTITGLRPFCGDSEITIALLERTGLQPRPADVLGN